MKRTLKYIFIVCSFAALLVAVIITSGWLFSAYSSSSVCQFPAEAAITPDISNGPGSEIRVKFTAVLPEAARISAVEFECGKDGVASGGVSFVRRRWQWNKGVWEFTASMRALTSGGIGKGTVTVAVVRHHRSTEKFIISVPETAPPRFTPASAGGEKLLLAPSVETVEKSRISYHWLWLLPVIILAAAVIIHRRRKKAVEIPLLPWETAAAALEKLRSELSNGEILPESAFIRLTDIVRNYLECRFALPASRRTTVEFMLEVSGKNSPLSERQRRFLHDFLTAADLIKFARLPSDTDAAENAAVRAEELVKETVPVTENTEKKK